MTLSALINLTFFPERELAAQKTQLYGQPLVVTKGSLTALSSSYETGLLFRHRESYLLRSTIEKSIVGISSKFSTKVEAGTILFAILSRVIHDLFVASSSL